VFQRSAKLGDGSKPEQTSGSAILFEAQGLWSARGQGCRGNMTEPTQYPEDPIAWSSLGKSDIVGRDAICEGESAQSSGE